MYIVIAVIFHSCVIIKKNKNSTPNMKGARSVILQNIVVVVLIFIACILQYLCHSVFNCNGE